MLAGAPSRRTPLTPACRPAQAAAFLHPPAALPVTCGSLCSFSHTHMHTHTFAIHPPILTVSGHPSLPAQGRETCHPNPNKPGSIKPRNLLLQEGSQHCALLPEAVRSRGSLCPAEVGPQSPVDPDRTGLHGDLAPLTRHTEKPGSLCFFLLTEERNRKENHVEILGTKQTQKETVSLSLWRACFPAGAVPGSSGKSLGCYKKKKKKAQLAFVWFSAKACLFKSVLGVLRGQPSFNCVHMAFGACPVLCQ